MSVVPAAGMEPLPLGTPDRFLLGAPLPSLSVLSFGPAGPRVDVRTNAPARAWRITPHGVVRVQPEDGRPDGFAPVLLDGYDNVLGLGRVAAPPANTDPRVVSLDAVFAGGALWLGEAVRGNAPVLARLPAANSAQATAVRLQGPQVDASVDEEIGVASEGHHVYVASTRHAAEGEVTVELARAEEGARAAVVPVALDAGQWTFRGRRPGVGLCRAGGALWMVVASRDRWSVGALQEGRMVRVADITAERGRHWDETFTARCDDRALLVYGRERPRSAPVLRCAGGRCARVPTPSPRQPIELAAYSTAEGEGRRREHPEWPLRFVTTPDGAVLAVRAAGSVATVARWAPDGQGWGEERVVFDAAREERGATVQGVELYGDARRVMLAVATAGELRMASSEDGGRSWHAPAR